MEILLTLTYVALCYFVFKLFRIPVNQWTLATAGLGGIFGLSLLFITVAYNHPFSTNARIYFTVTPVLPGVRGLVTEVPVEDHTNQHLEAGDVLFKIDPKPYEYTVAEKRAGLADAEANVAQLKASVGGDRKGQGAAGACPGKLRSSGNAVPEKRRGAGDARHRNAQSRCGKTDDGRG